MSTDSDRRPPRSPDTLQAVYDNTDNVIMVTEGAEWDRGVLTDADRGPGIRTHTGWFFPLTPKADEVEIRDIAHSLAMLCRFGGHVNTFYSVAQHCVLVSQHVPPHLALVAFLHDAPEYAIGDVVSPVKRQLPAYGPIEDGVWGAIVERYALHEHGVNPTTMAMPPEVKHEDLRALVTEMRDLWIGTDEEPSDEVDPWPHRIWAFGWRTARYLFLRRWQELTGERVLRWWEHWPIAWVGIARVLNAMRGGAS